MPYQWTPQGRETSGLGLLKISVSILAVTRNRLSCKKKSDKKIRNSPIDALSAKRYAIKWKSRAKPSSSIARLAVHDNANGQANNRFTGLKGGGASNIGCYYRVSGSNLICNERPEIVWQSQGPPRMSVPFNSVISLNLKTNQEVSDETKTF